MPVENTSRKGFDVIDGACFAYYDESFRDCLECCFKEKCQKATSSENVHEIRKQVKNSRKSLKEIIKQFE